MRSNQTDLQFVTEHAENHLSECACCPFLQRTTPGNLRDYIDQYVSQHFLARNWPKNKAIEILDIGSGKLLQTATLITSLVRAGFSVNLTILDAAYKENYHNPNELKEYTAIAKLRYIFEKLNESVDKKDAAQLVGIFSNIDSYLATLKGVSPLKYEILPAKDIGTRVAQGAKRRYLLIDLGVGYPVMSHNERFEREFKEGNHCYGKPPDLVLTIDDITEFYPLITGPERYQGIGLFGRTDGFPEEYLDYAYKEEIVIPLKEMNPNTVFIGTHKKYSNQKIELRKIETGEEWIIYGSDDLHYPILVSRDNIIKTEIEPSESISLPDNENKQDKPEIKKVAEETTEMKQAQFVFNSIRKLILNEIQKLKENKESNLANEIEKHFQDCILPYSEEAEAAFSALFYSLGDKKSSLSQSFLNSKTKHGFLGNTLYDRIEKWVKQHILRFDNFSTWKTNQDLRFSGP